jgi:hypothetical protein
MRLIRWTVVAVAVAILGVIDQDTSRAFRWRPPTMVPHSELDGAWEILSVHRDGEADPVQIGAYLTFANGEVKFQPNVRQFNFNDIS